MLGKPCPFCGSDEMEWSKHHRGCYLKMMQEVEGEEHIDYTPVQFLEAWNRRATIHNSEYKSPSAKSCPKCHSEDTRYSNNYHHYGCLNCGHEWT